MSITKLTADSFEKEVLQDTGSVLVDFYADWCGPCKALAPILDELSGEYAGKCKIAKINIDEASDIAQQYGIRSIPTMIFFKNGEKVDQVVGGMQKPALKEYIDNKL